jgi:hypothetical protein
VTPPERRQPVKQLPRRHLDGLGKSFQGRELGIALAPLDPAYLAGMDTASLSNLFLRQPKSFARLTQVRAEGGHGADPAVGLT